MKIEILIDFIDDIIRAHEKIDTLNKLDTIARKLNPAESSKVHEESLEELNQLISIMENSAVNFHIANTLSGLSKDIYFLTPKYYAEILKTSLTGMNRQIAVIRSNCAAQSDRIKIEMNDHRAFLAYTKKIKLSAFYNTTNQTETLFKKAKNGGDTLEDFMRFLELISKARTFIARGVGEDTTSPRLLATSSSDPSIIIELWPVTAAAIAATVRFALDSTKSIYEIRVQRAKLKEFAVSDTAKEEFEAAIKKQENEIIENIASQVVSYLEKKYDKNDIFNKEQIEFLEKGISMIANAVVDGAQIRFKNYIDEGSEETQLISESIINELDREISLIQFQQESEFIPRIDTYRQELIESDESNS